jgi:hypothetical protein
LPAWETQGPTSPLARSGGQDSKECEPADASVADATATDSQPSADVSTADVSVSDATTDAADAAPLVCNKVVPPVKCQTPNTTDCIQGAARSCIAGVGCPPGFQSWQCYAKADCTGNDVCCAPALGVMGNVAATCTAGKFAVNGGAVGSQCGPSCGPNVSQLCSTASDCPNGYACVSNAYFSGSAQFQSATFGVCTK